MEKHNGTTVQFDQDAKRFRTTGKAKQAATLADMMDALRGLPPWVADDLIERFMQDLRRAKKYWSGKEP